MACRIFSCSMQTLSGSMWGLVSRPGIKPEPSALGTQSLSGRSKHSWCLFCEVVQISNYMTPFTQRFCGLFLNILSIITQLYSKVGQRQMLADAVISNILVLNMTM